MCLNNSTVFIHYFNCVLNDQNEYSDNGTRIKTKNDALKIDIETNFNINYDVRFFEY